MRRILPMLLPFLLCAGCYDQIAQPGLPESPGWESVESGTGQDLVDVFFVDASTGWALCSFDSLLATTDGGKTWDRRFCDGGPLTHIHFTNRNNGWITTWNGQLLHSTDGGKTWLSVPYDSTYVVSPLRSVCFVDDEHGWIVGGTNGEIFNTTDGGTIWGKHVTQQFYQYLGTTFVDRNHGWAVGAAQEGLDLIGLMSRTTDGGRTWQDYILPQFTGTVAVAFADSRQGWLTTAQGAILHTTNGGEAWQAQNAGTDERLVALSFPDARNGWAIVNLPNVLVAGGSYDIFRRTTDGGATWTDPGDRTTLNGLIRLNDIQFVDPAHGWAVGENGVIWRTVTGGTRP